MHTNPDSISRRAFLRETATTTAAVAALPLGQAIAAENDWIKLFDGKTLDGWHKNPQRIGHGTGGHWFVEDGAIVGNYSKLKIVSIFSGLRAHCSMVVRFRSFWVDLTIRPPSK